MELFIRIKDGQPFEHPILADNFRQAFPTVDTNNLPSEFARFQRVACPSLVYATLNSAQPSYQWVNGQVQDVWDVTPMTAAEVLLKQQHTQAQWESHGFASWVFDEAICAFVPPIPYPQDGKQYRWDEDTIAWINTPTIKAVENQHHEND